MSSQDQTVIYDSALRRHYALDELREIFRYRNLIQQLIRRDVLTRYKRSVLGIAWTMLNPLGMMIILSVAFSRMFNAVPSYPAYVLSGLIMWNFFSQTTTASMVNLVWGGGILHRIYIPRTSFALAAIGTGMVNQGFAILPLLLVMLVTGTPYHWTMLLFPLPVVLTACFALGIGLLLSTFAIYFPDVAEMYQIFILGWFYLTPVIYPESILPAEYRYWLTHLNPMYYMVRLFRLMFYEGRLPLWNELWPPVVISLTVLAIGWYVFSLKSDEFSYRV